MNNKISLLMKTLAVNLTNAGKIDYNKWIFSSTDNVKYNFNSKYLFEYVKENVKGVTPYYVINDDKERERLQTKYGKEYFIETTTIAGIKKAMQCGVWFTSAGLPVYGVGLRKRYIIVNLWHGVPLKKIGLLDPNLKGVKRLYFKKVFSDNYRYILTTSRKLVDVMRDSFEVEEKRIKIWGQPRNDGIFQAVDSRKILTKLYTNLPEYDRIILYAPTFRDNSVTRLFPFPDLDIKKLEDFLEKKKVLILIRSHIYQELKGEIGEARRILEINSDKVDDITDLLGMFDLLITDYSSIYIDYLLTEHPLLFLPYDKEEYLKERGMNFEYDQVTPGPKPENMERFIHDIEELLFGIDSYKEERHKINCFFNQIQKPCSKEICDRVQKLCLRVCEKSVKKGRKK